MILVLLALLPGAFVLLSLGQTVADLPQRIIDAINSRQERRRRAELDVAFDRWFKQL